MQNLEEFCIYQKKLKGWTKKNVREEQRDDFFQSQIERYLKNNNVIKQKFKHAFYDWLEVNICKNNRNPILRVQYLTIGALVDQIKDKNGQPERLLYDKYLWNESNKYFDLHLSEKIIRNLMIKFGFTQAEIAHDIFECSESAISKKIKEACINLKKHS